MQPGSLVIVAALLAGPALAEPDPERGASLAAQCAGCHADAAGEAIHAFRDMDPESFTAAMQAYRNGERTHISMRMFAGALEPSEFDDLAAWLAEEDTQ